MHRPTPAPPLAAADDDDAARWQAAVNTPAFRQLIASKRRLLLPMVLLYLGAFAAVCLLAGYARPWFAQPGAGGYNRGTLLIAGIYLMSWALALVYVWFADHRFDPQAEAAVAAAGGGR